MSHLKQIGGLIAKGAAAPAGAVKAAAEMEAQQAQAEKANYYGFTAEELQDIRKELGADISLAELAEALDKATRKNSTAGLRKLGVGFSDHDLLKFRINTRMNDLIKKGAFGFDNYLLFKCHLRRAWLGDWWRPNKRSKTRT